jgi:FkbM family methyltransferase
MNWMDTVATAKSAEQLRSDLVDRYPEFAESRLRELVVLGAAAEGERMCQLASAHGLSVLAVIDDDPAKAGAVMPGGITVAPSLPAGIDSKMPIVIASHRVLDATMRMRREGRPHVLGAGVLQTMEPERFPPHSFYANWLEDIVANADQYRRTYDLFADDRSREIFAGLLGYRISGDIGELQPYVDRVLFYPQEIFRFDGHEVYVDAGCYTGDTIELFIERTGASFDRIIGFEPDPSNFEELSRRLGDDPRIELKPMGLYDDRRTLRFAASHDRAAALSETGDIQVEVSSIDAELKGDRTTFIKMNIEGAELAALKGGRHNIGKWKPKLCVSGYHLASHLWEVPLLMKEICPDYRIFLRQHDGGVIESTFYAVA